MLKPARGSQINITHPLSRGLAVCLFINESGGNILADLSKNKNNGSISGTTWSWTFCKNGSCLKIPEGGNNIIVLGAGSTINNLTEFTIIQHLNTYTLPDFGEYKYAICQRNDVGYRFSFCLNFEYSGKWDFHLLTDDTDAWTFSKSAPSINTEYLMAVTYSDNGDRKARIYSNGIDVSDPAAQIAAIGNIVSTSTTPLCLGNRAVSLNRDWDGEIGNTIIYNRALTASEIMHLYRDLYCIADKGIRPEMIAA